MGPFRSLKSFGPFRREETFIPFRRGKPLGPFRRWKPIRRGTSHMGPGPSGERIEPVRSLIQEGEALRAFQEGGALGALQEWEPL